MTQTEAFLDTKANQILAALATPQLMDPLTGGDNDLTISDAYAVADRVGAGQNRQRVGVKVGFTNKAIWPVYNVDQPIWGEVHAERLLSPDHPVDLSDYVQPRIEPEIVVGFHRTPAPDMSRADIMACIGWIAPGFEVVQSIYPDWRFSVVDAIAAQALHGCLILGDRLPASRALLNGLAEVPLTLQKGLETVETGQGSNALGGPLEVLVHLISLLPDANAIQAGDLVTTGTLTDAWPIQTDDHWSAFYGGVIDTHLSVRFT